MKIEAPDWVTAPNDHIPLGYTRDTDGRVLTWRNSEGNWHECTRDTEGRLLTYRDAYGYWHEYTRDADGRVLTWRNSEGNWHECTRDTEGRLLTYRDAYGYWHEYTYDTEGRMLTYRDSDGADQVAVAHDARFTLFRDRSTGLYTAGCRGPLTAEQALAHWGCRTDARAKLFAAAIKDQQQ